MLISLFVPGSGSFPDTVLAADSKSGEVLVIPVHGTIDLGLAYFVKRSLAVAEREGASAIILDVNTFGGRVDAAVEIRDALDECSIPTSAFVNKRAISAGALICFATRKIAMAPGSTIGAATPVGIGSMGGKQELGEKEVSYVRGEFRATAERNGHSPLLAEAMVDPDVTAHLYFKDELPRIVSSQEAEQLQAEGTETETISQEGKLLTMTAEEAKNTGLAETMPPSVDDFMRFMGFEPAGKVTAAMSWSEYIVRFLTNPVVSGLLLALGVLGIYFELQMPGWGISGTVGAALLLLFFGGHYLAGLASVADMLLFAVGLGLLALEVFVFPGFGLPGISGFICILAGIYLALVKRPIPKFSWDYQMLNTALGTLVFVVVAVVAGIIFTWKMFSNSRFKELMILSKSEYATDGFISSDNLDGLLGKSGRSLTHLRPTGRALIAGDPVEVLTEGEFIEKDWNITVTRVVGNKVFVAREGDTETS